MKLIAHRGLLKGPDTKKENHPDQIMEAVNLGFECEIDLRVENSILFLGHDEPQYQIDIDFLLDQPFWIHAKNLNALYWLSNTKFNYFWHQEDDFILTSHGFIWTFPGKPLTDRSVCVMPELNDPTFDSLDLNCLGICSDYMLQIKNKINQVGQL